MYSARRYFLKRLAAIVSVVAGGIQLAGCLGESGDPPPSQASESAAPPGPTMSTAPAAQPQPAGPSTMAQASGPPVWQESPTIEFVEGVPAVVSVRDFVRDPDLDPLVITLKSGALIPGLMWNPTNATISYDGRALGATESAPVVVSGLVFTADDQKP